jgi:asparagine synthase (glutamine-hydrolysing)
VCRRFQGQWAFAIWDSQRRKLFLSRDRLGVRPLFFSLSNGSFLFASEMKALLAHPSLPHELDAQALDQIFTFWSPVPPRTIFRGIQELPPCFSMTLEDGRLNLYRHWQLDYVEESLAEEEAGNRLFALMEDAALLPASG